MKHNFISSLSSMTACCGENHTITLSNDGTLHSFGYNGFGQLGLGNNNDVSVPSRITTLPKIKQVSCGGHHTFCIDYEGFLWAFGNNGNGQLGTGNTTNFNVPQKILEIPPVVSVSCGYEYTLIITNDSNLWACGYNGEGQLFLNNQESQSKFRQTSFSNISKISAGYRHSLFQNNKGEIFGCGRNNSGAVGLGHFNHPQIQVSPILNAPGNIVHFCCGHQQSYFLDSEGNVYSAGYNGRGELGLGHNTNQNTLNKIPNIPPIQSISSIRYSCYLIDFEGNVWSFGYNANWVLGHGDTTHRNVPTKIESLKNIQQLSCGSCGQHFLAKDSQNKIFVTGYNGNGQLGMGNTQSLTSPTEINSQYSAGIWGNEKKNEWTQMISETMNWKEDEMNTLAMIQSKIQSVKTNLESNNNNKIKQEFPQNSFESWIEVEEFLNEKLQQINSKMNDKQDIELNNQNDVKIFEKALKDIDNELERLQSRKKEIEENILPKVKESQRCFEETFKEIEKNQTTLKEMCNDVSIFCKNEKEMNEDLVRLYSKKKFEEFDCSDISKLLWKMDLSKYQQVFEENQINGLVVSAMDFWFWEHLGVEKRDCFHISFNFEMMKTPGYSKTFSPDYEHDCCVCSHNSPKKTVHLLKEYDIPIEEDVILKNNYCSSILTNSTILKDILGEDFCSQKGIQTLLKLSEWKKSHEHHLIDLKK